MTGCTIVDNPFWLTGAGDPQRSGHRPLLWDKSMSSHSERANVFAHVIRDRRFDATPELVAMAGHVDGYQVVDDNVFHPASAWPNSISNWAKGPWPSSLGSSGSRPPGTRNSPSPRSSAIAKTTRARRWHGRGPECAIRTSLPSRRFCRPTALVRTRPEERPIGAERSRNHEQLTTLALADVILTPHATGTTLKAMNHRRSRSGRGARQRLAS